MMSWVWSHRMRKPDNIHSARRGTWTRRTQIAGPVFHPHVEWGNCPLSPCSRVCSPHRTSTLSSFVRDQNNSWWPRAVPRLNNASSIASTSLPATRCWTTGRFQGRTLMGWASAVSMWCCAMYVNPTSLSLRAKMSLNSHTSHKVLCCWFLRPSQFLLHISLKDCSQQSGASCKALVWCDHPTAVAISSN